MKIKSLLHLTLVAFVAFGVSSISAASDDLGANGQQAPPEDPPLGFNAATSSTDVDNGDGTWTHTMWVDENSTPPHYAAPSGYGFDIYSWYDQDYGWMHNFPHWNDPYLNVLSATLTIRAWDVDSEPSHGYNGEYDGVYVDGTLLSPGYLQGTNQTWSTTVFDLPLSAITDDGDINVWLDIDMHHNQDWWATTVNWSSVEIVYSVFLNDPPYQPELSWGYLSDVDCITGAECIPYGEGLAVEVVGPTPADPDDDLVTYTYRWFVDVGTGGFIDDEFAGRGDHTGNTVPASDIQPNDIWQVQVIPTDEHGAIGEMITVIFPEYCTVDCPYGCIAGTVTSDCPEAGTGVEGAVIELYEQGTSDLIFSTMTDANGAYDLCDVDVGDYMVVIVPPAGYAATVGSYDITVIADDYVYVDFVLDCRGCVDGYVVADCPTAGTGLFGVDVDAYAVGSGLFLGSAVTDENGYFQICDLPFGDYTLTVVTPLGYATDDEETLVSVATNQTTTQDFALTCPDITASPRTIGFWKHQVGVATGGRGRAQVDAVDLCDYLDLIEGHFNSNAINQVIVYDPPAGATCDDKFLVAKDLLNLKESASMFDRAKQQLMALLLNVAGDLIGQTEVISDDGATVSQAITFCDGVIDDGDPSNDEMAKTIVDEINNGRMVPAGVIPLSTANIAYKQAEIPVKYGLSQNYPNPFNPTTSISFTLPMESDVTLEIYNILGQKVATLIDDTRPAGRHTAVWNSTHDASGVYFYRLTADEWTKTKKMLLLR